MQSYRNSDPAPPIMQGTPPAPEWRVPMIDWDRPPWNRWAFQHVRELLPTAQIRRGDAVSALPEAAGRLDDLAYVGADGRETTFGRMLDETYTDAMLVWKDGRVLHESYHNGMGRRSVHLLQSVTKSVTSAVAGSMIGEGLFDPAAQVTAYLPELARTAWAGASVQQVLDMTTGVRFNETYEERDSDVGKMDFAAGWKPGPEGWDVSGWPTCVWDQILGLEVNEAAHGERFHYRSVETDVLAHVMERVSGKRLPVLISERLWQPLGCEEDANITLDSAGYGLASGGMSATLRDMARFGLALLNDGRVEGRQVIPAAWIADIRHGKHGLWEEDGPGDWPKGCYRNQFWIEDGDLGRHYCFGVFGQMVMVAPDTGTVAVKFSTWPEFVSDRMLEMEAEAMKAVERIQGPVGGSSGAGMAGSTGPAMR